MDFPSTGEVLLTRNNEFQFDNGRYVAKLSIHGFSITYKHPNSRSLDIELTPLKDVMYVGTTYYVKTKRIFIQVVKSKPSHSKQRTQVHNTRNFYLDAEEDVIQQFLRVFTTCTGKQVK